MIERLGALLADLRPHRQPPTPREVAELLWLARALPEHAGVRRAAAGQRRPAPAAVPGGGVLQDLPDDRPEGSGSGPGTTKLYPAGAGEATPQEAGGAGPDRAAPVRVAGPAVLPHRREVARALRPFKRRVPSTVRTVLDEEATAGRIADHHHWMPVLAPAAEHWLDAVVVLDSYLDGAALWEPLGRELRSVLQQSGAFRNVTLLHLRDRGDGGAGLSARAGSHPALLRPVSCAVDPTGRTLTLVLTDGVAPQWRDAGPLQGALRRWAGSGPTAILQTLPEHVWEQTALAPQRGHFRSTEAGSPNSRLLYAGYGLRPRTLERGGMAVPVLAVTPEWLGPWARTVAGPGAFDGAAVLLPGSAATAPGPAGPPPQRHVRFEDFRARAQPDVFRLAGYLAAAPLNLAVMRTVQSAMLPDSPPSDLAEIVFSGLLHRTPGGAAGDDALGRAYEFAPGMRERLLGTIRRDEADEVIAAVSAYVERHAPSAGARFTAAVADPSGALSLPAGARHFAEVSGQVLGRLRARTPGAPAARTAQGGPGPRTGAAAPEPVEVRDLAPGSALEEYIISGLFEGTGSAARVSFGGWPIRAGALIEAIAARVGTSRFLAERLATMARAWESASGDSASLTAFFDAALPDAFAAYLARFGSEAPRADGLLHSLAYAQGDGFSQPSDWAAAATAVSGRVISQRDVEWFLVQPDGLVVPGGSADGGGLVFALPHESWARLLRARDDVPRAHGAIAAELVRGLPARSAERRRRRGDARDWPQASPYVRVHLATHAAAGGTLDGFLADPDYVCWADPASLLRAARTAATPLAETVGRVLPALAPGRIPPDDRRGRRDAIALTALELGHPAVAGRYAPDADWAPAWFARGVTAVALGSTPVGGTVELVAGGAQGVQSVLAPAPGTMTAAGRPGSGPPVSSVGCITIEGLPHVVSGGGDRTVRVRNLLNGSVRHRRTVGYGPAPTVACVRIGGLPFALFGSSADSVRLWDLTTGATPAWDEGRDVATGVFACARVAGEPYAVLGVGASVQLWDLTGGTPDIALAQNAEVTAVACLDTARWSYAVTGLADGTVGVLNLAEPSQTLVRGLHTSRVIAAAAGVVDGQVLAVTSSQDGLTHIWDTTSQTGSAAWTLRLPRPATALHLDGTRLAVAMDGPLIAVDLLSQRV